MRRTLLQAPRDATARCAKPSRRGARKRHSAPIQRIARGPPAVAGVRGSWLENVLCLTTAASRPGEGSEPHAHATAYRLPREWAGYIRAALGRSTPGDPAAQDLFGTLLTRARIVRRTTPGPPPANAGGHRAS